MIAVLVLGDVETFHGAVVRARRHDRDFALERHEGFEDAGLAADVASASGAPTSANAAVRMPSPLTKFFSTRRSCVIASTCGSGSTGTRAARKVAVSAGTFSNS